MSRLAVREGGRWRPTLTASFRRRITPGRPLSAATAGAGWSQKPQGPPFIRRAAYFALHATLVTALSFAMTLAPALEHMADWRPPTDAEIRTLLEAADDGTREREAHMNSLPIVAQLRADSSLAESRPHLQIPSAWRPHNLMGGTLSGPGRVSVPPLVFSDGEGQRYVQVTHVGTDLCGHVGVVHGGFLATMLDEGLARCCMPALPYKFGVTAKLEINYKLPAQADQYLILRAVTTSVEGRKAWVEGHIETLPAEGEEPKVLATATALFVSPKAASTMARVYSSR